MCMILGILKSWWIANYVSDSSATCCLAKSPKSLIRWYLFSVKLAFYTTLYCIYWFILYFVFYDEQLAVGFELGNGIPYTLTFYRRVVCTNPFLCCCCWYKKILQGPLFQVVGFELGIRIKIWFPSHNKRSSI